VTCRFDELYEEAVPLLLAGAHQRDVPPTEGGRWPVSVFLAPSGAVAERLHGLTAEAARIAGPGHFWTGARGFAHFTVRALETYRESASAADDVVRRWTAAMTAAAARCRPVGLRLTGLTLTAGTVMARAEPLDDAAWEFMAVLAEELGEDGWFEAGFRRTIWYANLLHFAADLADPAALVDWVSERRNLALGNCVLPAAQLVRFVFDKRGSVAGAKPVVFAEAAFGERPASLQETRSQTV
jgi:hypothetical protein